jgi:Holliday junction DNA helicase RuvA
VSGVGPKVALAIVSGYSPGELQRAIIREDADLFQTIPGIGKKTAQRVVLELKEKIAPLAAVAAPHLAAGDGHIVARDALVELGYSIGEAEQRLSGTDPDLPPAERVRQALRAA